MILGSKKDCIKKKSSEMKIAAEKLIKNNCLYQIKIKNRMKLI